jgi:hypothetical protein
MIKRIIERWNAIKKLIMADEYFLGVAKQKENYSNVMCYDYINNTNRDLFYTFVHDYIEENLRPISGKFICTNHFHVYKGRESILDITQGTIVHVTNGMITKIESGEGTINEVGLSYLSTLPTKELYAHFTYIS